MVGVLQVVVLVLPVDSGLLTGVLLSMVGGLQVVVLVDRVLLTGVSKV